MPRAEVRAAARRIASRYCREVIRLWVDTDLALGTPAGDVDDGFALAAVVRAADRVDDAQERIELLGISVVDGNAPADRALDAVRRLLQALGADTRVVAQPAAAAAIANLPEGASVLALGPPGNLNAAARLDPTLPARTAVRVVGTVTSAWRHPLLRLHCLNFGRHPGAAREFFALRFRERRVFPLDVVRRLRVGRQDLDAIAATGEVGRYLARHSERWLRQAWWRHRSRRFPLWDLVAALDAIGELEGATFAPGGLLRTFDAPAALRTLLARLQPQETQIGDR